MPEPTKKANAPCLPRLGDSIRAFSERFGSPVKRITPLAGRRVFCFRHSSGHVYVLAANRQAVAIRFIPAAGGDTSPDSAGRPPALQPAAMRASAINPAAGEHLALISGDGSWTLTLRSCPPEDLALLIDATLP